MHVRVLHHLGRRFALLSAEASPGVEVQEAYGDLMKRCSVQLGKIGLTLENTVRTRLWARTSDDRNIASAQRRELLGDGMRPASSSYIAPDHFLTDASVAVDLLAMEPSHRTAERFHVELDPPINPPRFLVYDGIVFLSGVSAAGSTLKDAVEDSLSQICVSLERAGLSWPHTIRIGGYVQRRHALSEAREELIDTAPLESIPMRLEHVDGFSGPLKQIEIECSAATSLEGAAH